MGNAAIQRRDYSFVVRKPTGERQSGLLTGLSEEEALARLHAEGKVVLKLVEASAGRQAWRRRFPLGGLTLPVRPVGVRELALFTRQLATVFGAGIPIVRGLRGLAADISQAALAGAVEDIALRIEKGETLSAAFGAHPEVFNTFYVSMIRAGESAGALDTILDSLSTYLEKTDGIRTKVRSALSYPVFVLVFSVAAACTLLLKTVPTFARIYADMGQKLPGLTLAVVGASHFLQHNLIPAAIAVVVSVTAMAALARRKRGRRVMDGLLLRVPVFGPIVRKSVMSRICRTLGLLLSSGVPILEALQMVKDTCGNAAVGARVEAAGVRIAAGQGMAAGFRGARGFPEMVLQLITTGEESGTVDAMVLKGAEFYERQVDAAVDGITSLIEPILIVLVGGMIGVVVIAMFLPIFHMGEAVMRGGMGP
jgi:type IV pilus assembly protein PilC